MATEDTHNKVLEYLKKQGSINTFRLARDLNIERHKLLNVIEKLEGKGAVEVKHGLVKFLSFLMEEKKPEKSVEVTVTKARKTPKKKAKRVKKAPQKKRRKKKSKVLAALQTENKQLKENLLELEAKLKRKPKTITRTIVKKVPVVKTVIKKVPVLPSPPPPKKKKKKRRKKAKKKQKKAMKKIKKRKVKKKARKKIKKIPKIKSKKLKFPKFKFMKGITKLKRPGFAK